MDKISEYINQFESVKNEWLEQLVAFMREEMQLQECFDYKMPTYRGHDFYIAFAAQKNYFSFYTDEARVLELFKAEMPSTSLGKTCARIKYNEPNAINITMNIIKEIILMHRDTIKENISDLAAIKKWKAIPAHGRKMLSSNVFCGNCGVTTLEKGFTIHDDGPYGIILRGKCKKCNRQVARCVESDLNMAGKNIQIRNSTVDFMVFTKDAGSDSIEVRVQDGDVWLTQKAISMLFEIDRSVVTKHIKNILETGELDEDYFEHLISEIQEIRASERRVYQKNTDIYATAVDYSKDSKVTRDFFATLQNKMHLTIHGNTAAEVIVARANHKN